MTTALLTRSPLVTRPLVLGSEPGRGLTVWVVPVPTGLGLMNDLDLAADVLGALPPAAPADDAHLLRQIAAGDRQAVGALYDSYARRLYGLGLRLLGDAGLAEELVQETFVRIWRTAARFDSNLGSAATFIFTIARRLAIDLWRRPSSRPFEPDAGDREQPGDAIDRVVVGLTVREALDALSAAHREVLDLAYVAGLTQMECAQRLGLPLGTVKTRTFHALKALKTALEARGVDT